MWKKNVLIRARYLRPGDVVRDVTGRTLAVRNLHFGYARWQIETEDPDWSLYVDGDSLLVVYKSAPR